MAKRKNAALGGKKVVGFSADPELRAKIRAYAEANKFTDSAAMRYMIVVFLREYVNSSNVRGEVAKS